jgi:hypothetical protein
MSTKTITEKDDKIRLRQKQKMLRVKAIERIRAVQPEFTDWEYAMQTLAAFYVFTL